MSSWSDVTGMLEGDYDFEVADTFNQMIPIEAYRTHRNNARMARGYLRNAFRRSHRRRRSRLERQAMISIARRSGIDVANRVGRYMGQRDMRPRNVDPYEAWIQSYAPGGSRAPRGPPQNEATEAIWGEVSRSSGLIQPTQPPLMSAGTLPNVVSQVTIPVRESSQYAGPQRSGNKQWN